MKKIYSTLITLGIGAVLGAGGCYLFSKPSVQSCEDAAKKAISQAEEKYKIPTTEGVAGPGDISTYFVISEKAKFSGLVFTESNPAKRGVYAKSNVLGNQKISLEYTPLEGILNQADVKVPVQPEVKVYTAEKSAEQK